LEKLAITTPYITLQQVLKWAGIANTGGEAKELIAGGSITINGEVETRRGRKLYPGDRLVLADGREFIITGEDRVCT
jgi:ribosome-associated protein